jgi:hypothetical protein
MTHFPLHRHKAIHKQSAIKHHFFEAMLVSITTLSITLLLAEFHLVHHIIDGPELRVVQSPNTIKRIAISVVNSQVPNSTALKPGCDTGAALEVLPEGENIQQFLKKTNAGTKSVKDTTRSFTYNPSEDGVDIVYLWVNGTGDIAAFLNTSIYASVSQHFFYRSYTPKAITGLYNRVINQECTLSQPIPRVE